MLVRLINLSYNYSPFLVIKQDLKIFFFFNFNCPMPQLWYMHVTVLSPDCGFATKQCAWVVPPTEAMCNERVKDTQKFMLD